MASIESLRRILGEDLSDEEVIKRASELAGWHPQDVAEHLGLETGKERGPISAGLRSGYEDTKGLMYSTGAALANVVGAKGAENWANRQASDREIASQIAGRRDLERIEDQSLGSIIPYAGYQASKQATNAIGAFATGLIAPEAAIPGAVARGAAYIPNALGGGSLAAAENFVERKAALAAGRTLAKQVAGGAVYNEANAIGSLYQNAKENPEDTHPGLTALAGSVPYALAETVPEAMLGGKLLHSSGFEGNFLKRAAKNAAVQAPAGAASELLQTKMELAVGKPVSEEEARSQYLNAGVAGGLVEGLFGAAGAIHPGKSTAEAAGAGKGTPLLKGANEQPDTSTTPAGNFQSSQTQPNTGDSVQQALNQTNLGATPTQGLQAPTPPTQAATAQGTTAVAQNAQAAQAQQAQQAAVAQQQQAAAQAAEAQKQQVSGALQAYGVAPSVDANQGSFFGKPLFGPSVSHFGTALAQEASNIPANQQPITQAIAQANTVVGGKMVQFKFDASNPAKTVSSAFAGIGKVALKYQLHSATTPEEAADRLNIISKTAKGTELEHVNAIHQVLTGKDTTGYIESQQSKGAKNGNKQPQRQVETTPGVGGVSVQGGSTQAANGGGNVGGGNVQPIGAGSVPQGTPSQQIGSNAGEGVRNSTDANLLQRGVHNAGNGTGQGQINEQAATTSGESQQPSVQAVAKPTVAEGKGARVYDQTISYYATDLSHIKPARREEIRNDLIRAILAPEVERAGVMTLAQRVDMVTMALIDGEPQEDIAKQLGVSRAAVQKQLERLGIVVKPRLTPAQQSEINSIEQRLGIPAGTRNTTKDPFAVSKAITAQLPVEKTADLVHRLDGLYKSASKDYGIETPKDGKAFDDMLLDAGEAYRSAEFPDGIGAGEIVYLYSHDKNVTTEQSLADELENGSVSGDRSKLLAEEMRGRGESNEGQSMGVISQAGGSQGSVESLNKAFFDRIEKLTKKMEALPPKDPRRATLEAKIKDEWAKYGKKQDALAKQGELEVNQTEEGEEENAVQEQSTDEGNVRKPAQSSKKVGKGNAESKKSTKQSSTEKTSEKPSEPKKVEPTVIKTDVELAEESWNKVADTIPGAPKFAELTKDQRETFIDYGKDNWTPSDVRAELVKLNKEATQNKTSEVSEQPTTAKESTTPPVTSVTEELLTPHIEKLTEGQTSRLEKFYGVKRGTAEFAAKVRDDVVAYINKGATAVAGAVRDIIKAVSEGVLAVALVFNPSFLSQPIPITVPITQTRTIEVTQPVPAEAAKDMSAQAKRAYEVLYPAIKDDLIKSNKLFLITDKPTAMQFVFNPDGTLLLKSKVLLAKSFGDFAKGDNNLDANKITPAGLRTMVKRTHTSSTEGYDFDTVFGSVETDPDTKNQYFTTYLHSVYTHLPDAPKRLQALKEPGAQNSRYSFGCINVDKATFGKLLKEHENELDGATIFIVPDKDNNVMNFINGEATKATDINRRSVNPVTKTITTTIPNANQNLQTRVVVGKEEKVNFLKNPRSMTLLDEDNNTFVADEKSLSELDQKYPGIARAFSHYENRGMAHVLDAVEAWYVTDDEVPWDGAFMQINGQNAIVFRVGSLHDAINTEWTTHHEIGHAIDDLGSGMGGIFSSLPEFNVAVKNNKIIPMGNIIKEVHEHYLAEPNSELSQHLVYPFDRKQNPNMDGDSIREELFAQLWASYNTSLGRDFLEEHLPNVADFMEKIYDDVEKTKYGLNKANSGKTKVNPNITQKTGDVESGQLQRSQVAVRLRENRTQQRIEKTIDGLPPNLQKPTKVIVNGLVSQLHNKFGAAKDIVLKSAITEDIVKFATKHMPSAARYLTSQYARQADVAKWNNRIDKILTAHDALEGEEKGTGASSVNKFIEDSVMLGKWGYMPEEHRIGTTLIYDLMDDDLVKRFKAFSSEGQEVIKDYFEHGYQALIAKQIAAKEAVNREFAEAERLALGIPNDEAQVAADKKAAMAKIVELDPSVPYGHLARYGNYLVVAKSAEYQAYEDILKGENAAPVGNHGVVGTTNSAKIWMDENQSNPTHYVVQFADTIGEAKAIANNLAATGHYDHVEASPKETEASYTGGSDMHLAVARLRNLMKRQTEDKGSPEYKALDNMIGNLYLMTVAQNSAKKFTLQQKKIAGYDSNMMRNLATAGRADAHFLATMKHNDAINDSIDKMREEARRNRGEAMPYFNELINRHTQSMDYKIPSVLAKTLNQMNHIWSLTFSPAFYLQQMLQTGAISLPYLAGRIGYANATRHIARAYDDIAKIKDIFNFKDVNNHVDFSKAPADVRAMLGRLVGMGKIDIGMDSEFKARSHEQGVFGKVMYKMQGITNRIEAINRSVAAIAAYRGYLERYGNTSTEAAIQYASDVVSDTHGSYDSFNTPRALKGVTGQIIGQFRRFQIIQLSMLGKLIHSSFNSASKEERMVARKTLAFISAQMAVVGGALGVPFVSQLMFLTLKMFGSPDEPDDPEYKLRKLIGNPVAADLLLRGVTGAVGWESLGKKLSMENVASPFGGYVVPDLTSRTGVEQTALAILGPSLNLAEKFADAYQLVNQGNYYKGIEMAMPNGIANILKAVRFAEEGMTMRNGDLVMKPQDVGILTAASQLVGLPTNQITHQQFAQKVKAEYDKEYEARLTEIKGEYVKAARASDYKAMSNAREEFKRMEESRVANGYKRQPLSELLKAPMAAKKRENSVVNGVESSKQNKQFLATMGV